MTAADIFYDYLVPIFCGLGIVWCALLMVGCSWMLWRLYVNPDLEVVFPEDRKDAP